MMFILIVPQGDQKAELLSVTGYGLPGRALSGTRWLSAAEAALLELIVLAAVGIVGSSLKRGLSGTSLSPSQNLNHELREGTLADVKVMEQPLKAPCYPLIKAVGQNDCNAHDGSGSQA